MPDENATSTAAIGAATGEGRRPTIVAARSRGSTAAFSMPADSLICISTVDSRTPTPISAPTACPMQRNKVHHVYTVDRVAKDLGVDEELIRDLTLQLEPEDGVIWVYGVEGDAILAFTDDGVEEVRLLVEEHSRLGPEG